MVLMLNGHGGARSSGSDAWWGGFSTWAPRSGRIAGGRCNRFLAGGNPEPGQLLRLRAETKMPGKAWLQWKVIPREEKKALLLQTSFFAPKGLLGWLYWYAAYRASQIYLWKAYRPDCNSGNKLETQTGLICRSPRRQEKTQLFLIEPRATRPNQTRSIKKKTARVAAEILKYNKPSGFS